MRKSVLFMMMAVAAMLVSCGDMVDAFLGTDDHPVTPQEQEQLADYTILYYANGGSNVDRCILPMISDFYKASPDAYKKVNVVVQYKFSTTENLMKQQVAFEEFTPEISEAYGSKTVRWAVDPTKTFQEQVYSQDNIYCAHNADCTCPDSLTNFINWAAKAYPAKKYMLIVNDHGKGYKPHDELPETAPATTRGLLFDDGYPVEGQNNKHFTAKTFHRAVAAANVRFETIFMLACLMNNLEYQFELQDLCDYVIASTYVMPSWGGALYDLPELLSQPNVDIERALDAYCKADVASWDNNENIPEGYPLYCDLTVTKTANIARLGLVMREFTDRLCNTYQNGTDAQRQAIDSCTAYAVKVDLEWPYYDVAKYMASLMSALPEIYGDNFYSLMKETFNSCIVAQYYSKYLTTHDYMVDYSVLLGTEGTYSLLSLEEDPQTGVKIPKSETIYFADGKTQLYNVTPTDNPNYYESTFDKEDAPWGSTLADTYEQLAFDRVVGWSRWLKLNRQHPNMFCPSGLNYELPMP